jgi:hypothetical protein
LKKKIHLFRNNRLKCAWASVIVISVTKKYTKPTKALFYGYTRVNKDEVFYLLNKDTGKYEKYDKPLFIEDDPKCPFC